MTQRTRHPRRAALASSLPAITLALSLGSATVARSAAAQDTPATPPMDQSAPPTGTPPAVETPPPAPAPAPAPATPPPPAPMEAAPPPSPPPPTLTPPGSEEPLAGVSNGTMFLRSPDNMF